MIPYLFVHISLLLFFCSKRFGVRVVGSIPRIDRAKYNTLELLHLSNSSLAGRKISCGQRCQRQAFPDTSTHRHNSCDDNIENCARPSFCPPTTHARDTLRPPLFHRRFPTVTKIKLPSRSPGPVCHALSEPRHPL